MQNPEQAPQEYIAFLEQQLAGAVMFLRQKDATEEACVKRLEEQYRVQFAQNRDLLEERRKQFDLRERELGAGYARYALLRQYQVQVWSLGIAATGENLDRALDEQIRRAQKALA